MKPDICPNCGKQTLEYYLEDHNGALIIKSKHCKTCGYPEGEKQ